MSSAEFSIQVKGGNTHLRSELERIFEQKQSSLPRPIRLHDGDDNLTQKNGVVIHDITHLLAQTTFDLATYVGKSDQLHIITGASTAAIDVGQQLLNEQHWPENVLDVRIYRTQEDDNAWVAIAANFIFNLIAKTHAVHQEHDEHHEQVGKNYTVYGDIKIVPDSYVYPAVVNGIETFLTPNYYRILSKIIAAQGADYSRETLCGELWPEFNTPNYPFANSKYNHLTVTVKNLNKQLESMGSSVRIVYRKNKGQYYAHITG